MQTIMLKAKIHRATVTESNVDYEGSITIDEDLMEAASILPFEQLHIYNVSNGNRFETYAMRGDRGSRTICVNGAAAHQASKGDLIIIASYGLLNAEELSRHRPKLIYVDEENRIIKVKSGD